MKKTIIGIACLMLLLFGCQDPNKGTTPGGNSGGTSQDGDTPELNLVSIKILNNIVDPKDFGKEIWGPFTVENGKATLDAKNDIEAKFKYGKVTEETITVTLSETALQVGNNEITLSVPAVPKKHKAWSHKVTIKREGANGQTGVDFNLDTFKVKVSDTPVNWARSEKVGDKFVVEVPNSMISIPQTDVEAYFTWNGMGNPKPRKVETFTVTGGFPIAFPATETEKEIELKVAENVGGVNHPEWNGKVTLKRQAKPELKKIKLQSLTFQPAVEIKDFASGSHNLADTTAQSINVFFYKSETDSIEDAELVNLITTEPELEKKGVLKIWKLNAENNTLKIKMDGQVKYTITVKRKPVIVDVISVGDDTGPIAENLTEGQSLSTSSSKISIAVTQKQHYQYTGATVTVGAGQAVPLTLEDPANPASAYVGKVSLQDGVNNVVLKVGDISGVETLALVRNFKVTKTASQQGGTIENEVKIEKLWIGYGTMTTLGEAKFEAQVSSTDPHEYTVDVNEFYAKTAKLNVSLVVKGIAGATDAEISDMLTTERGKADGATLFTSKAEFKPLADNNTPYEFKLSKGGKTATYKVKVNCNVKIPNHTIQVNQLASGGEIKVWRTVGFPLKRENITSFPATIENKRTTNVVYIELVATDPKKPKKLVINGVEYKTVTTGVSKQTPGAIAVKVLLLDSLTVSGEVE